MKIALVIKHYGLLQGGAERYAVDLSRALVEAGCEVHVLANRYEPDGPATVRFHQVKMIHKPSWLRVLSFAGNTRKIIAEEQFDIVYALTQIYPQDLYLTGGGVYRHWLRVRYPSPGLRWLACLARPIHLANVYLESRLYAAGNNRMVIANSRLCKNHVQSYWQVPEERIALIYHGVDHAIFNPQNAGAGRWATRRSLGIADETPLLLFVSNNWKRKGLTTILRSLGDLEHFHPSFALMVIGRGNPKAYRGLIEKYDLEQRVHFIGHTDEILNYYGAADLVVLPTLYDSFGNVCIEAMACGTAVITSRSSGVAELIRPGVNGFVLEDPQDAGELSNLLTACSRPDKLRQMGRAAGETALEYTPERNARETLAVCRRLHAEKIRRGKIMNRSTER